MPHIFKLFFLHSTYAYKKKISDLHHHRLVLAMCVVCSLQPNSVATLHLCSCASPCPKSVKAGHNCRTNTSTHPAISLGDGHTMPTRRKLAFWGFFSFCKFRCIMKKCRPGRESMSCLRQGMLCLQEGLLCLREGAPCLRERKSCLWEGMSRLREEMLCLREGVSCLWEGMPCLREGMLCLRGYPKPSRPSVEHPVPNAKLHQK